MDKTLKIVGNGSIHVKADMMILFFTLHGQEKTYDKTIKKASYDHEKLCQELTSIGIDNKFIITTSFIINQNFINVRNKDNIVSSKQDGFRYSEQVKVCFDFDNVMLSNILTLLSQNDIYSDMSLSYGLKDENKQKQAVMLDALNNAVENANAIAKGAKIQLGEIISIEYGTPKFSPILRDSGVRLANYKMIENDEINLNVSAKDIVLNDTITLIYSIK